jgi:hypothetical protein
MAEVRSKHVVAAAVAELPGEAVRPEWPKSQEVVAQLHEVNPVNEVP